MWLDLQSDKVLTLLQTNALTVHAGLCELLQKIGYLLQLQPLTLAEAYTSKRMCTKLGLYVMSGRL